MKGELTISINYEKFNNDGKWDGLKGYVTNTKLAPSDVVNAYKELWHIQRAFRISKTDLRVRPIYHRVRERIEAHFCICFTAYTVFKELERLLHENEIDLSIYKVAELVKTMYQIEITLPSSNERKKIMLKPTEEQKKIIDLIQNLG